MNYIAQQLSLHLYHLGKIEYREIDDISFGIEVILAQLFTFLPMIIIGLLAKKNIATIIFILVFISLRLNSKGYHFNLFYQCFFATNGIYLLCVFIFPCYLDQQIIHYLIAFCFFSFIIAQELYYDSKVKRKNYLILQSVYLLLAFILRDHFFIEITSTIVVSEFINFRFRTYKVSNRQ